MKLIPLGGVGEVGKNMLAIEYGEDIIVIDAGLKFPEEQMLGVDFMIPDISYLIQNQDRVRGIFITHGHEDHVGALPYVLPQINVPVYATKLTRGLIEVKLKEHRLANETTLVTVCPGDVISLGSFDVEFVPVNHSIPDGVSLFISTPIGSIFHTGDFKFDKTPVSGKPTDMHQLAEIGRRGVLALLSDCVRVERAGYTPSEQVVGKTFDTVLKNAPGRVVITTFASNISRIQQAMDAAAKYGRKVVVLGRSLSSNLNVACQLGYLTLPEDTVMRVDQVRRLPDDQIVFITTGSQGEPTSVLSRIAKNDHRHVTITSGDTVVLAATPVPGNEENVAKTIDDLLRLGADVVYEAVMTTVHVSGHGSRDELRELIELINPRYCIPVHGDYRHMVLYRKLAQETGMAFENVVLAGVGDIIELTTDSIAHVGTLPNEPVLIDGSVAGTIGKGVLRQRQNLGKNGVVVAVVGIDRYSGEIIAGPELTSRGFVEEHDTSNIVEFATIELKTALDNLPVPLDQETTEQTIYQTLGSYFSKHAKRRPVILPIVTEVG